jgi:hypothetical protein
VIFTCSIGWKTAAGRKSYRWAKTTAWAARDDTVRVVFRHGAGARQAVDVIEEVLNDVAVESGRETQDRQWTVQSGTD